MKFKLTLFAIILTIGIAIGQTSCYETVSLPIESKWGGTDTVGSVLIGNTYGAGEGPGIYIVADGGYRLYLNGELLAFDNAAGRLRFIPMTFLPNKNSISIVGINGQNAPGVLMHLDELSQSYVTNSSWKVNTTPADNSWKNKTFNDVSWSNATNLATGSLTQTPSGVSFSGFPQTSSAKWIWTSNSNDKNAIIRFSFNIKAVGFGESTTGGDGGQIVVVKTLAELNKAVTTTVPLTILIPEGTLDIRTFRKEPNSNFCQTPCGKILPGGPSVGIRQGIDSASCVSQGGTLVDAELWNTFVRPQSNKSIIGMGRGASLRGATIYAHQNDIRSNIIVRNLKIWDVNPHVIEARDGILLTNASQVWVDHCTFKWISDGNDMAGMKKVTFSWNKWDGYNEFVCSTRDNYSALVQNTDVTFDHIFWNGSNGRVPKTYGADTVRVHMINNYHYDNTFYASHSNGPTNLVYIENSHYEKVRFPTQRVSGGVIYSSGNLFQSIEKHVLDNYAATTEPKDLAAKFKIPYQYTLDPVEDVKNIVTTNAGAGGKWGTMPTYTDVTKLSNVGPKVSITSPLNNSTYANPNSVTISANASDLDGTISKIEFYSANTLIGTSTKSPYTINFTNFATCKYSVVAIAFDNSGNTTMSNPIVFDINTCTPSITASGSTTFCNGGKVVLSTNAGTSYKWFKGTTQVATTATYTATSTGSYTVEVTYASGCKATSTATTVTVNALPTATITASGATTFCNGGSVNLTSSTGSSYVWKNGTTTIATTASYTAKTAGNYTVIVTNASGCKATSAATNVTVNALPTANITASGATTFCNGGSVNLTSSTGTSYVWRNGTTTVATTASYLAKTAGSYTVIVTNASGCKDTSTATTVTVNALPTATITASGATTFCNGGSVNLTSSTGASYIWKNGTTTVATTASYTAKTAGNYTVIVTNASGCKDTSTATTVTVNALPTATITTSGATTFCNGGSVNLTSSTGTSYVWRNGTTTVATTASYSAKTAGSYSVIVTNASGCKDTSAATTVTVNALPTATITASGTTTFCNGGSVNLTSSTATSYVWKNGTTNIGSSASYTAKTAGNYTVIVTNASGCKDTSAATSVAVNALPTATITASGALTFCNGGSVNLTSSTGSSYVWRNGTTTVATTASYLAKTAGNYTVILTNASGCKDTSAATTVTVNALPTATITASGATTFCNGGSVNLTSSTGTSYVWRNGITTVATTASYLAKTSGNYTVIVTNASGCKDTSAATVVTVNALPTATITASGATTFCNGGSVNLTSSTGSSYVWRNGSTTVGTTASYTAKTAGSYTVIVTNASGCKDTSAGTTVTVNALPTATITASGATTFCNGGSVNLTSSTGTSYVWKNGTTTVGSSASYSAKTAGSYSVIVTNASGCKDTSTATVVTVNTTATPSAITGDDIVCANATSRTYSITNIADASAYTWTVPTGASITSGANTNSIVVSFASTSGDVTVSTTNGCGVGSVVKKAISITTNCITFEALPTKTSIDLTWDIAGINVKTIQIMRNTSASTSGRIRLTSVGYSPQTYSDTSALDNTDYWYWLKITDVNNVVFNSNSVQGKIAVVTGVNPLTSNETSVYPNPYEHDFQIKKQGRFHYSIEDLHGKSLLKGEAENETLTGNSLPTGVYMLKITANNNTEVVKVVKK